jgi:hypothetical protein
MLSVQHRSAATAHDAGMGHLRKWSRCGRAGGLPGLLLSGALVLCALRPSSHASRPPAPADASVWLREAASSHGCAGAARLRGGRGAVEAPTDKALARKLRPRRAGDSLRNAPEAAKEPTDGRVSTSLVAAGAAPAAGAKKAGAAQQLAVAQEGPVPLPLRRRPELQDVGSGWKNVKGKRVRVTGIDWDTWRRKRKVNAADFENSVVAPYEGSGPMLYQDVYGFSGKKVQRKVLRNRSVFFFNLLAIGRSSCSIKFLLNITNHVSSLIPPKQLGPNDGGGNQGQVRARRRGLPQGHAAQHGKSAGVHGFTSDSACARGRWRQGSVEEGPSSALIDSLILLDFYFYYIQKNEIN